MKKKLILLTMKKISPMKTKKVVIYVKKNINTDKNYKKWI